MLQVIATLITVQLIGLSAFPIVMRAFPLLSDRGWAISKALGILLISTGMWLLSYVHLLPNTMASWWIVWFVLTFVGAWFFRQDFPRFKKTFKRRWRIIVSIESIFLVFFLMFLSLRAFDPASSGTEKPMDMMMLTAVTSTQYAPPQDLWLAGEPIAYYYFGYWIYGGVGTMSGVPPFISFNISLALAAGLAASIVAALVCTLVRRDGATNRASLLCGALSATLLLLVSNLSGLWTILDITRLAPNKLLDWYHGFAYQRVTDIVVWRPDDFWWWWNSSRITNSYDVGGNSLDFTIQEFPYFSFLLGDLHPHLMSIPFVLTGLTVITSLFMANRYLSFRTLKHNLAAVLLVALVLGSSGFINFWDIGLLLLFTICLTLIGWVGTRAYSIGSLWRFGSPIGVIWIIGIVIFSPFYFGTAESQVQWPPIAPVEYGSRLIHFVSIWSILLIITTPVFLLLTYKFLRVFTSKFRGVSTVSHGEENLIWWPAWLIARMLVVIPWFLWAVTHIWVNERSDFLKIFLRLPVTGSLGLVTVIMVAVTLTRSRRGADDGAHYIMLLASVAIYLLFAAELFFVHDLFGNRMNTVFKFYYQAWILLSVAGGYGAYVWLKQAPELTGRLQVINRVSVLLVFVLIFSSIYFSVASSVTKTTSSSLGPSLDSMKFLEKRNQDEKETILRIWEMAETDDILVESVGESYSDHGRIAGYSGVPGLLGWKGHELQWHGDDALFIDREEDVETIYTTTEYSELNRLIDKYSLTMVVVGPRERSTYGDIDMSLFDTLGERVIESGSYTIFKIDQ
jgi:YYY domain-containing protein